MVALASSFGTPLPSLPSVPPVPVASSFDLATGEWVLVFDKDIDESTVTPTGFTMTVSGQARVAVAPITVDGNVLSGDSLIVQPVPAQDNFNYNKGAGTWAGANGLDVENFQIVPSVGAPLPLSAVYQIGLGVVRITMSEDVFINTATKQDFVAVSFPTILTVQSVAIDEGNIIELTVNVDGPGDLPSRVEYSGKVDGIEDGSGNDVPLFIIGLDTVP